MPHVDFNEAQQDVLQKLNVWVAGCPGVKEKHPTSRYGTHIYGTGYQSQPADKPATILDGDWKQLVFWWNNTLKLPGNFRLSYVGSSSGGPDVWDLCCECNLCQPIASGGGVKKQPNFVYHLKTVKIAPPPFAVIMFKASSNDKEDSLQLDYRIEYPGGFRSGRLGPDGRAREPLPVGVTVEQCRIGLEGSRPSTFRLGMPGMLPGGRYMVQITSAWAR